MKETRMPFSAEMIRALLEDKKHETRKVINPQPVSKVHNTSFSDNKPPFLSLSWQKGETHFGGDPERVKQAIIEHCPYGQPGDIILATETWRLHEITKGAPAFNVKVEYRATGSISDWIRVEYTMVMHQAIRYWQAHPTHWRPARYMPKEFSRIKREIVEVRAERLQDITLEGILAEGWNPGPEPYLNGIDGTDALDWFIALWDSINAKRGYPYSSNPWDWVLTFKKVEA